MLYKGEAQMCFEGLKDGTSKNKWSIKHLQSHCSQADVGTYFIWEAFSWWTFEFIDFIDHTEVTSWGRKVIRDDKVSCIEFGMIYNESYFIVRISQKDIISNEIF